MGLQTIPVGVVSLGAQSVGAMEMGLVVGLEWG